MQPDEGSGQHRMNSGVVGDTDGGGAVPVNGFSARSRGGTVPHRGPGPATFGPPRDLDYHPPAPGLPARRSDETRTMPTLSSILVQRGAATMRAVEDAIARQVLHGGDLPTNLLELGAVREETLATALAESFGIDAAPPGRLPAPGLGVTRLVPGELALRNGIFPLSLEGGTLLVATAEPLPPAVEEDLGFALDVALRQIAAPLVRVRQAIAEHYGLPLERRFARLCSRLDGAEGAGPSALPPAESDLGVKMPSPISVPSPNFGTGLQSTLPGRLDEPVAAKAPFGAPPRDLMMPAIPKSPGLPQGFGTGLTPPSPRAEVTEGAAAQPAPEDAVTAEPGPVESAEGASPAAPSGPASSKTLPAFSVQPGPTSARGTLQGIPAVTLSSPADPRPSAGPARDAGATRALAGVVRQALRAGRAVATLDKTGKAAPATGAAPAGNKPLQRVQRRKGPFTAAMAEHELEDAASSEAVLEILFTFALQFFEYTVLFVIHGDLAEGRDASGPGADRAKVAALGVPLDLPSNLARARERRAHVVARVPAEGLDADLARDLARGPRSPSRAIGLFPVVVRNRAVALVYGDDGDADVQLESLGEVIAVIGLASSAFERVALRKKLGGKAPDLPLKPRAAALPKSVAAEVRAGGAMALAKALALPSEAPPEGSPATLVTSPGAPGKAAPTPLPAEVAQFTAEPPPVSSAADSARARQATRPGMGMLAVDNALRQAAAEARAAELAASSAAPISPGFPKLPDASALPSVPDGRGLAGPALSDVRRPTAIAHEAEVSMTAVPKRVKPGKPDPFELTVDEPGFDGPGFEGPGFEGPVTHPLTPSGYIGRSPPPPAEPPPASTRLEPAPVTQVGLPAPTEPEPAPELGKPIGPGEEGDQLNDRPIDRSSPRRQSTARRGLAPTFEGRAGSKVDAPIGFEPLPRTPPPNATAWTSFPSSHPPPAFVPPRPPRPLSERPIIPREEPGDEPYEPHRHEDEGEVEGTTDTPGGSVLEAATDGTPAGSADAHDAGGLVQRVIAGGRGSQEAFNDLVRLGEQALPALMARFPGPLTVDRHRARSELPAASQCGPVLELVVAMRRAALPFMSVRSSSSEPEARFWATHLLGELRYPEAANVLVPRLFDDDASVRRVARRSAAALVGAGTAGAPILQNLDHVTRNHDEPIVHRVLAIETMGEIRHGALVPPLLVALTDPSDEVGDAARRALLLITRQDYGHDARRWHEWWAKNSTRHRIEWLMDALMHDQPSLRRAAGDELKLLTKEYFGYYDDLPKKDRERAQGLYRAWWEREGRDRFM